MLNTLITQITKHIKYIKYWMIFLLKLSFLKKKFEKQYDGASLPIDKCKYSFFNLHSYISIRT